MPIGAVTEVANIIVELSKKKPKSVLDLGIGMGFYGVAIRQWLDMGYKNKFKTKIHGVEGFDDYKNSCWDIYNRVEIGDILVYEPTQQYDAILLCDVIEHFEKEEGIEFIQKAKTWLNPGGKFIITTPARFFEQGNVYGNEFERHRSLWDVIDFAKLGFKIINNGNRDQYGCYMLTVVYTNNKS